MRKIFLTLFLTTLLLTTWAGEALAQSTPFTPRTNTPIIKNNGLCFNSIPFTITCEIGQKPTAQYLSMADKILAAAKDKRVEKLKAYFAKHHSPLEPFAHDFVYYADAYQLDWKLVPAISGVESTFGKHIPANSFNAYGWANGDYRFTSWPDSIEHVSRTLRTKYFDRGVDTIPEIARVYAPPSQTWGRNVQFFMDKIEAFEI